MIIDKPKLLHFPPYTKDEIIAILENRISMVSKNFINLKRFIVVGKTTVVSALLLYSLKAILCRRL